MRISSDRTGQEAGVGRQLADIRALAQRHGDQIVAVCNDNDESAYLRRKPRPGFTEVVELIKAGEVQVVYAWHPDRLYRSLRDLEDLVDLVDAHRLVVRTVKAGDIDLGTATGRMTARVVGSMARYESEHKADRQARQHASLAEAGKPSGGGRRPLGFQDDQVSLHPVEAPALRDAAEQILAGETMAEAARQLSTTLGRSVRPNILRNILTGPRVAGLRQHIPAADRRRGVTAPTLTEAVWEPIIDTDTWTRLRSVLLDPSRRNKRPPRTYLLSGIVSCTMCGTPMAGGNGAYKCSASSGGCGRMSVAMAPVDHYLIAWLLKEANRPAVAKRLTRLASETMTAAPSDSAEIEQRKAELATLFADRVISADEWRIARDRLEANSVRAKTTEATRARSTEAARRALAVLSRWDDERTTIAEKRATVAAFVDRIDIEPRGKRAGSKFDPSRLHVVPRAQR